MSQLVFNLDQMGGLATTLGGIGDRAQLARLKLMLVDPSGLPPEATGEVERQLNDLRRLLDASETVLDQQGHYLTAVVAKVRREEAEPGSPLSISNGAKAIIPLLSEPSDATGRTSSSKGKRARRYASSLNAIVGVKLLDGLVRWGEFREAVRKSRVPTNARRLHRLRSGMDQIGWDKVHGDVRGPPDPSKPTPRDDTGLRRLTGRLASAAPYAGAAADGYQLRSDAQKFERERGWNSETARNGVAVASSGLHNAANGMSLFPPAWAAAAGTEVAAYGLDIAVLGYDVAPEVVDLAGGAANVAQGVYHDPVGAAEDVGKGLANAGKGLADKVGL